MKAHKHTERAKASELPEPAQARRSVEPAGPLAPAPERALKTLRTLNVQTYIGLTLLAAFLLCCASDNLAVRWWLMLPLAAGAAAALRLRARVATGVERSVCVAGFWLAVALFLLRDISLSRKLAELFDKVQNAHKGFESFMGAR